MITRLILALLALAVSILGFSVTSCSEATMYGPAPDYGTSSSSSSGRVAGGPSGASQGP